MTAREKAAVNAKIAQQRQSLADANMNKIVSQNADNRELTRLFRPITDAVMGAAGNKRNFRIQSAVGGVETAEFTTNGILQFVNTFYDGKVTNAKDIAEQLRYAALQTPDTKAPVRDLLQQTAKKLEDHYHGQEITKEQLGQMMLDANKVEEEKAERAELHEPEEEDW
eukprot:gene4023-15562_t